MRHLVDEAPPLPAEGRHLPSGRRSRLPAARIVDTLTGERTEMTIEEFERRGRTRDRRKTA